MRRHTASTYGTQAKLERLGSCVDDLTICHFTVCFVKYKDVIEMGKLLTHEQARACNIET